MESAIKVLDKGFVRVVDKMGDDSSIVQAARISYGAGTKHTSQDRSLIRYLMRHKHTSPFEMCEIKLHVKMPIFVARQWIRHRTANVNEYSGRYSIIEDEFYIPQLHDIASQSVDNKQGRGEAIGAEDAKAVQAMIQEQSQQAYEKYQKMLDLGVARELARVILPQNIYTEFYWKIDLHNLFHFLHLRLHKTAQFEIREYAVAIDNIVKEWMPIAHEAFNDYRINAEFVAGNAKKYLKRVATEPDDLGKTELQEFNQAWPIEL